MPRRRWQTDKPRSRKRATVEEMSRDSLCASKLVPAKMFRNRNLTISGSPLLVGNVSRIHVTWKNIRVDFGWRQPSQVIQVSWTRCHFGGGRPWLHCFCGRRVAKLLPDGDGFFCRQCLGNPMYACQSASTGGRKHFAAAKLRLQMGASASLRDPPPTKPRGMRKATFNRLKTKLERLEAALSARVKARKPDYPSLLVAIDY
jgi:hypothetical protein